MRDFYPTPTLVPVLTALMRWCPLRSRGGDLTSQPEWCTSILDDDGNKSNHISGHSRQDFLCFCFRFSSLFTSCGKFSRLFFLDCLSEEGLTRDDLQSQPQQYNLKKQTIEKPHNTKKLKKTLDFFLKLDLCTHCFASSKYFS